MGVSSNSIKCINATVVLASTVITKSNAINNLTDHFRRLCYSQRAVCNEKYLLQRQKLFSLQVSR